ncbi:MAG: hypothetical protein LBR98_04310 [Syntrophomonadaceae bacterium]|jgi:hypothetical protein|nr:hypothetical protein [Syntrophomonadaceae bacterium]
MKNLRQIWSPVILAELSRPRVISAPYHYHLEEKYDELENVRLKVLLCSARFTGAAAEVQIKLQILCLVRDAYGPRLLNKETLLNDRTPLDAFNRQDWSKERASLTASVSRLDYHGRLLDDAIAIDFVLEYFLRVTQEQAVSVVSENAGDLSLSPASEAPPLKILQPETEQNELIRKLRADILRIEAEKASLNGKLRQQERNAQSLRYGVKKAELRNLEFQNKIRFCEQMITDLRKTVAEKEGQINRLRRNSGYYSEHRRAASGEFAENLTAGKIIKRLFHNNG